MAAVSRSYASPEQWRGEVHAGLVDLVRARCQHGPIAIVLEDVHWIDASSLDAVGVLLSRVVDLPILEVVLFRPDFQVPDAWLRAPDSLRIDLAPLSPDDTRRLIDSIGVAGTLGDALTQQMIERSGGNPFYVEEIVKSFLDRGVLRREGDRWVAAEDISLDQIPDTIEAVLRARIDRLPVRAKRVLEQAAVIGRAFETELLARVTDVHPVGPPIDYLESREFIAHDPPGSLGASYIFPNILVQEVAYHSLLMRERRGLHGAIARAYGGEAADEFDARIGSIAYHFLSAEEWGPAARSCTRAGDRAKALYANVEAIEFYSCSLTALDSVPADDLDEDLRALRIRVLLQRGEVVALLTRYDEAQQDFTAALDRAALPAERAESLARLGEWVYLRRADYDAALATWERGLEELSGVPDVAALRARLRCLTAEVLIRRAAHDRVGQLLDEALEDLRGQDQPKLEARIWRLRGQSALHQTRFDQAIECWERALEIARNVDDVFTSAPLVNNLAIAWYRKGQARRAVEWFEQALRDFERAGDSSRAAEVLTNVGGCYRGMGDLDRAIDYYRRSLVMKERMGDARGILRNYLNLGEALRDAGDPAASLDYLEKSLRLAREIGAREVEPEIVRQIADSRLAVGDVMGATEAADTALALARERKNRLEEAFALRSLSRIDEHEGRLVSAEDWLRKALAILAERGADRDLHVTRAELVRVLAAQGRSEEAQREAAAAVEGLDRANATSEVARLKQTLERIGAR